MSTSTSRSGSRFETLKVLSIPRGKFILYSFRPLKWLRFLGYAIYGAEGDIFKIDGLQHVDYDSVGVAYDARMVDGYIIDVVFRRRVRVRYMAC